MEREKAIGVQTPEKLKMYGLYELVQTVAETILDNQKDNIQQGNQDNVIVYTDLNNALSDSLQTENQNKFVPYSIQVEKGEEPKGRDIYISGYYNGHPALFSITRFNQRVPLQVNTAGFPDRIKERAENKEATEEVAYGMFLFGCLQSILKRISLEEKSEEKNLLQ
ncbi:MAG TPA: hypothetical protein VL401_00965 [Alphaproteobacteria bacterium]|jgi:hypothetical protein|nr:hypothetical protein [Alphaproteobacteria bacterium]